jgi:hypothetical protein
MQLTCPRCHHTLEYSGDRPSFCAWCGNPLAETKPALTPVDPEAPTLAPGPAAPGDEPVPEAVGGYRLLRVLGGGGMGTVYEAEDTASGRHVALKLISADYAGSPDAVERFRQEGRLASALSHPRCVFVLAADEDAGRPYIVMELMPGPTLQDLVEKNGPLSPEEAVAKILDVIEGLQEAHRQGVVHRDVKPSNCFVAADGRVKVGDFGLAKSLGGGAHLTRTGAFIGTPLFASPEQIRGERVDEQSDVYSAAATLYCLLAGKAPFHGSDPAATLARIVSDDPPPLRGVRPELPASLERAVLRGLERDRARRWRDLEEFRRALLPFIPGRVSLAGLGARFGANLLDVTAVSLGVYVTLFAVGLALPEVADDALVGEASWGVAFILYYGTLEGRWGWSPGKRLLGLRVRLARGFESPGVPRALWRAAALYLTLDLGTLIAAYVVRPYQSGGYINYPWLFREHFLVWLTASLLPLTWFVTGIVLTVSTMRRRNGYRGLHEFLSGTRVVALPALAEVRAVTPRRLDADAVAADDLPPRLGPFAVRGVLRRDGASAVLLGESASLGRRALLWLRPADEPPLAAARRDLARPTRLRWLAAGRDGDRQWDAFLAPGGCPLADWVAGAGRLSWADVRPVLAGLTAELIAADEDGTLPAALTLDQVWVDNGGRVQLLDVPAHPAAGGEPTSATLLGLLTQVAAFGLEGRRRTAPAPVAAPVPLYARSLLARLARAAERGKGLRPWQQDLAAAADRPTAVSRFRRAGHAALLALFLLPGLVMLLAPAALTPLKMTYATILIEQQEDALRTFDRGAACEFVATSLSPDPAARLAALVQTDADLEAHKRLDEVLMYNRAKYQAGRDSLSPVGRWYVDYAGQFLWGDEDREDHRPDLSSFRHGAEFWARVPAPLGGVEDRTALAILLLVPAGVWVLWAFLWRGGLSDRLLGLALVQSDGRPAARWRCAWRALLTWVPVTVLLIAAMWLEQDYWTAQAAGTPAPWLARLSWVVSWSAWALLAAYAVLAVRSPGRGLHDRLAGTYLVPK